MTNLNDVFRCSVCGNVVEVVHSGPGQLVCCNQPMMLLAENTQDAATEKHVPVIEKTATGFQVTVGEVPHPMEDKHYIEWIELIADGLVYRKHLKPGDRPAVEFQIDAARVAAREYCNLHGHWRKDA